MPVYVPSKAIICISTIVSTLISLLAGYMLYLESISVLRDSVDEASAAASKSARLRLAGMLQDSKKTAYEGSLLFNRNDVFNVSKGLRVFDEAFHVQYFASLKSSDEFYGGGFTLAKRRPDCPTCTQPWQDLEGYTKVSVWYDPIYDSQGREAKYWLTGRTVPVGDNLGGVKEWRRGFHAINNDTGVLANRSEMAVVPSTLTTTWAINVEKDIKNMETFPTNGTWSPTYFWNSVDGSPYAYNAFTLRIEPPWGRGQYVITALVWFMFRPWTSVIREFETTHTELVALDPYLDQVFAHTIYDGLAGVKPECFTTCFTCADFAGTDCVAQSKDLGQTAAGAVNASKIRPRGTFFTADLPSTNQRIHVQYGEYYEPQDVNKTNPKYKNDYYINSKLDGGEYFLRMTHFYTAGPTTFELLWMRSVASVNEKVFVALVQLIIASVVIFVVDIIIAVLEVTLIARPLEKLVIGNQFLETMDLDGAEAHMKAMYKPIMVKEVARVTDGMVIAIMGLREYKAYLPNTLFVDESEDDSATASSLSKGTVVTPSRKSAQSAMTRSRMTRAAVGAQNLSMHMQNYKGTIVRLTFPVHLFTTFPDGFGTLVEVIQEAVQATKGLNHGFAVCDPLSFTLTWNIGLRCTEAMGRAMTSCRAIALSGKISEIATPIMSGTQGTFQAGNLGSATAKGFGIKGNALLELRGIAAVGEIVISTLPKPLILVGPLISEGLSGKFELNAVTLLSMANAKNPFIVNEVGSAVEAKEEEWMYQLQDATAVSDPVAAAFATIQADFTSRPDVKISDPTNLQSWSIQNIQNGNAIMSFSAAATWYKSSN